MVQGRIEGDLRGALPWLSDEVRHDLASAVERIVEALTPEQILLFGSQARGDATVESDVDLLVIVVHSDLLPHQRAQVAYQAVGWHSLALDILVMTREEFERRRKAPASLAATALREGRLLYAA